MLRKKTKANDPFDWFAFASERLKAADSLWNHEGLTSAGIECLQEAMERYLKGYLIAMGWRLIKTHDLKLLVEEARKRDSRFSQFGRLAEELTADFFAQHYPAAISPCRQNYETLRGQAGELVALIRESLPKYFDLPPGSNPQLEPTFSQLT